MRPHSEMLLTLRADTRPPSNPARRGKVVFPDRVMRSAWSASSSPFVRTGPKRAGDLEGSCRSDSTAGSELPRRDRAERPYLKFTDGGAALFA